MAVSKKKVVKKVAKKKVVKKKSATVKPVVIKFDMLDVLHQKVCCMEAQIEDKLHSLSDQYVAIQHTVLEALAKRPDVDAEFLHKRIVVLEMQVQELSAKLLELSPELS